MNTFQSPLMLLLPLAAVLLSWAACRWWYGRKLHKLQHRIGKLSVERETLQEQVKQARQQLGQLQKDMASWRRPTPTAPQAKAGTSTPEADARAETRAALKAQLDIPSGLVFETPQVAAHGFADTMPFGGDALA